MITISSKVLAGKEKRKGREGEEEEEGGEGRKEGEGIVTVILI